MKMFRIPEANMEKLQKTLARIEKKCNKYNVPFTYRVVGEEFGKVFNDESNPQDFEIVRFLLVEVEGKVKHNGWTLVATLDCEYSRNLIRTFNDFQVPDYLYEASCQCEHCNIRRARKHTYVLQNEDTGDLKQIGSTCVKEFTGGLDAESAAAFAELYRKVSEMEAYIPGGNPYIHYYDVKKLLRLSTQFIFAYGYHSVSACTYGEDSGEPTRDSVRDMYNFLEGNDIIGLKSIHEHIQNTLSDEDADKYSEEVIQWASRTDDTSEYMQNIKSLLQEEYVQSKHIGYVVSSVSSYKKYCYKIKRDEKKKSQHQYDIERSQHIGELKQRIEIVVDSASLIYSGDTMYGDYFLYRFQDTSGNVFTWGTSVPLDGSKLGQITKVVGTVKDHTTYQEVKQTALTRCKVTY